MPKNEKVREGWEDKVITYQTRDKLILGSKYRILEHSLELYAIDEGIYVNIDKQTGAVVFKPTYCPHNTNSGNRYMFSYHGAIDRVMLLSDYQLMMKEDEEDPFPDDPTPRCSPNCGSCTCHKYCDCANPKAKKVYISNNVGYVDVCELCGKEIDNIPF